MPKLTPGAVRSLKRAEDASAEFGHEHVGCEHIIVGILRDPDSIPSQLMERDGSRQRVLTELFRLLSSDSYRSGSNQVVDASGNYLGRMVIGSDGKTQVVSDDGAPISGPLEHVSLPKLNLEIPEW
jgi:ATP-dependent Clp protease ATP-binding subunit ClpA